MSYENRLLSMLDVIKISQQAWEEDFTPVEFGRKVAMLVDHKHKLIAVTFQNAMPMPRLINSSRKVTDKEEFNDLVITTAKVFTEEGCSVSLIEMDLCNKFK